MKLSSHPSSPAFVDGDEQVEESLLFVPDECYTTINNAGIILMERGCTEEAFQVFHDMVLNLKNVRNLPSWSEQVARATKWTTHLTQRKIAMDVQACNHNDWNALGDAAMCGPSSSVVFPIRLATTSALTTSLNASTLAAIAMCNLGLAHRCHCASVSNVMSCNNNEVALYLDSAQTALRAASMFLASSSSSSSSTNDTDNLALLILSMIDFGLERIEQERQLLGTSEQR